MALRHINDVVARAAIVDGDGDGLFVVMGIFALVPTSQGALNRKYRFPPVLGINTAFVPVA